jgi:hypothetical protein
MKVLDNEPVASIGDITKEMLEKRPLPIGRTQFNEWADRIMSGAMVEASERSQKWTLAEMVMHLNPTEAFKEDAHFILKLRKAAVNETCAHIMREIKEEHEAEKKLAEATATNLAVVDGAVLAEQKV